MNLFCWSEQPAISYVPYFSVERSLNNVASQSDLLLDQRTISLSSGVLSMF